MKFISLCTVLLVYISGYAQQTEYVDFKTATVQLSIAPDSLKVFGVVNYSVKILKSIDSIYIDAVNMSFKNVLLGNKMASYSNDGKKLVLKHNFKKDSVYSISFNYKVCPKKAMYFIDWGFEEGNKQVWTQGQGKYTSNWLPSFDDMNEKVVFDLSVTFDKDYQVIANGELTNKEIGDNTITWNYDMKEPMSSYLVALVIGKYNKKTVISKSGIPIELYYYPDLDNYRDLKFEPTYRYTKQLFDFLEEEIGVPYPWQNYKEVPVKDFLYAGMENTSTTIFSDSFVIDSIAFVDKNFVNVNAHELAHQWFGDLVTEKSGTHHWLQEGFATYYALLAERAIFGDDYYYWRLFEYAQELQSQDQLNQGSALIDPKASSATFYKRGAWALHVLREQVGDELFKKAVKNYLKKHQFENVETKDFINELEQVSGKDLKDFVATWLLNKKFPYKAALKSLKQSTFIQEYLMVDCDVNTSKCKNYLTSGISDKAKIKVITQNPNLINKNAFENSVEVRQAIIKNSSKIPLELKEKYESLLDDKSYLTIELALYTLWNDFPENRINYLEKTKQIQGFNDKNVRTLWLALALNTPEFEPENKNMHYLELRGYTSPKFNFEIRKNAFQYLIGMKICDTVCKDNLKQATKHGNWRFSKFAKDMLAHIKESNK
tara:strand:+ start:1517 stop:3496 length:1980 start_codon:yes stop_codon:yes gene_type:complete